MKPVTRRFNLSDFMIVVAEFGVATMTLQSLWMKLDKDINRYQSDFSGGNSGDHTDVRRLTSTRRRDLGARDTVGTLSVRRSEIGIVTGRWRPAGTPGAQRVEPGPEGVRPSHSVSTRARKM
jgi:hypothetical protein